MVSSSKTTFPWTVHCRREDIAANSIAIRSVHSKQNPWKVVAILEELYYEQLMRVVGALERILRR